MNENLHIEEIFDDYRMIAIIVYAEYRGEGTTFFTPNVFSQQLASIRRKKGEEMQAHMHKPVPRNVKYTQETLLIKEGKVKVIFYDENQRYFDSRILKTGDVVLLVSGGHAFTMLEDTQMIEVKQGPYAGENDKVCFVGVKT